MSLALTQWADVCEDFGNIWKNAHHPTPATPALVLLLQNLSSQPCTRYSSPVRNGFQAAHGIISDTRWMPLLAACHSSNPPRNSSATAVFRHKKTSSSSLKFSMIGLPMKPEHKVRKEWHLFQMAPCTQKMNTYLLLPMLVFSGLFNL